MNNVDKKYVILGSLCALVLMLAVGYAAFNTVLKIKGTSNISSNWDIQITDITEKNIIGTASTSIDEEGNKKISGIGTLTATFETNLVSPGDSIEYDITVSNKGNLNAKLDQITISESDNDAIIFTPSGLSEGDVLNAGSNAVLTVKVEYNDVTSQPEKTIGDLKVTLDYSQADGNTATPVGPVAAETLTENVTTTGDGLYNDAYEEGRYVYKGINPANYITFNEEIWRIIAVETDGTLKIMKNESIGKIAWDTSGSNNWTRPATLNTYLNNDYYNDTDSNIKGINESASKLIQTHNFSVGRVTDKNSDLAAQISEENKTVWNGNIGLISVSDFIKANNNASQCGNSNSVYNNFSSCKTTNYINALIPEWGSLRTISPVSHNSSHVYYATWSGYMSNATASYSDSIILPALYLKSDITLSGEGTQDKPYTINV